MAKLLGIDVGTSGAKALLLNEKGEVLAQGSAEYPLSVPHPLWAEQDPELWWQGVMACLEAIGEPNPDAIGVTGQMHGAVFLDKADEVIRPAILWCDQRTAAECEEIDRRVGAETFRDITCNPPLTGFQAPKLLWLRNNERENYDRVKSLLLPKDYIRMRLSGVKATEVSDASGTALFDVRHRRWSEQILGELDFDAKLLPEVFESDEVTAKTSGTGGLSAGISIVGGGGDQAAGAVGTGAVEPGVVSVSLGTSGVVFSSLKRPDKDPSGAAHVFCHANRAWHAMGVMLSCGGALRWLRDTMFHNQSYDNIARCALQAPVGAEGATFLPYLTGERCPYNDPRARGAFAGLTLGHDQNHIARAVFEGMSFGLLDGMQRLRSLGASADEIRITSGGAKSAFWVQMLADMFGKPCVTLASDEGPAYGAALLSGVGIGVWPDVQTACRKVIRVTKRVEPSGLDYSQVHERYGELYKALKPWNHRLD